MRRFIGWQNTKHGSSIKALVAGLTVAWLAAAPALAGEVRFVGEGHAYQPHLVPGR